MFGRALEVGHLAHPAVVLAGWFVQLDARPHPSRELRHPTEPQHAGLQPHGSRDSSKTSTNNYLLFQLDILKKQKTGKLRN